MEQITARPPKFAVNDEVIVSEKAAALQRLAKFVGRAGVVTRRVIKPGAVFLFYIRFNEGGDTASFYGDELDLLTDARIRELQGKVERLMHIINAVAELTWREDYIGVETPNVQVFFSRADIIAARRLMGRNDDGSDK